MQRLGCSKRSASSNSLIRLSAMHDLISRLRNHTRPTSRLLRGRGSMTDGSVSVFLAMAAAHYYSPHTHFDGEKLGQDVLKSSKCYSRPASILNFQIPSPVSREPIEISTGDKGVHKTAAFYFPFSEIALRFLFLSFISR